MKKPNRVPVAIQQQAYAYRSCCFLGLIGLECPQKLIQGYESSG